MKPRRSDSLALQLQDVEETVWQSLAVVCAQRPQSRPNTGELIRVAELLEIAGGAVKHAMAHRAFTDSQSVTWDVFDVYLAVSSAAQNRLTPEFRQGWLCFESVAEKRRFGPMPSDGRLLSDHDLERLLGQAEVVPVPRRRSNRPTDDPSPP